MSSFPSKPLKFVSSCFNIEPLAEGKIGGCSASAITIMSEAKNIYEFEGNSVK